MQGPEVGREVDLIVSFLSLRNAGLLLGILIEP